MSITQLPPVSIKQRLFPHAHALFAFVDAIRRRISLRLRPAPALLLLSILHGAMLSAQTAHFYMSESILPTPTGLYYPNQVAVDTNGSIYIADGSNSRVVKETPAEGGFQETSISTGSGQPYGVAVDQSGDIFIACDNLAYIIKETPTPTGYTQSTFGAQLYSATSVAVDSLGRVYVTAYSELEVFTPNAGSYVQGGIPIAAGEGVNTVAVDTNFNLYVTGLDSNYLGHLWKLTPSNGGYVQTSLAANPSGFGQAAVDGAGNIYLCNGSYSDILVFTPSGNGFYNSGALPQEQFYFGVIYTGSVAVDQSGNVFFTDHFNQLLVEYSKAGGNAGPLAANGGYNSQYPISEFFYFDTAPPTGSEGVVSLGSNSTSLDFFDGGNGSCAQGFWEQNSWCSVDVYFQPTAVGDRYGAAVLYDANGNTIATGYARGIGQGPLVNYPPGAPISENIAIDRSAVAVDALGNLYTVAPGLSTAFIDTPAGGTNWSEVPVGSSLGSSTGIAIDGAGNLYIADQANKQIVKETLSTNGYSQSVIASNANGLHEPAGVAVDASGNVYVTDLGTNAVLKETLLAGAYTQSVLSTSALNQPNGVAVDAAGDVYIADTDNDRVLKEAFVGGSYVESVVASGLSDPTAVAVDGFGNVYISETNAGMVLKETLTAGSYVEGTIASGVKPYGLALDSNLNLYIAGSGTQQLVKIDVSDAPALAFASTLEGTVSPDSPKSVTVANNGNASLTFPIPSSGNNPSIATNFTLNNSGGSACPSITSASSSPANLAAGASCTLSISFSPVAAGGISGAVILTDNNLGAANATQSIPLSGSAYSNVATTTSLGSSANPALFGQSVLITATVTQASGPNVPTGTVQFSIDGSTVGSPVALTAGDATYSASTLTAGTHSITAAYSPTAGSAFSSSNATALSQIVNKAAPAITWATPSAITYNTPLSATQLDASSNVPGTFNYSPALGAVLAAGPHTLSVTFTPTDATDYTAPTQTVQLTVNKAPLSVTVNNQSMSYGATVPILTGTLTGVLGSDGITASYATTGTSSSPVGPYPITATLNDPNSKLGNYTITNTPGTLTISKATPTVAWATPAAITYGTPLSATQLDASSAVAGSFNYTPTLSAVLTAGSQTLSVTFTPTDATDYTAQTQTVQLTINKAPLSVTVNNQSMIYGGTVPTLTGTLTGVVNSDGITASYATTGTSSSPVGPYPITATLNDPNSKLVNYSVTNTPGTLTISKATPAITWATPSAITYGTPLSATQLGASSTVPGSFNYTPALGAILAAGPQTLSVTFTPTDATDYTTPTQTVQLTVNKAPLSVTVNNQSMIYGGTVPTLTGTLTGVVNSDGITASYATTGTSSSPVGPYPITATLNDPNSKLGDYTVTNTPGTLTISKATPTVTWATPAAITYGTPLSATQLDASSTVAGSFNYTPALSTVLTAGSQTLSVTFTPTDTTDYSAATQTAQLTVNKAATTVTWATPAAIVSGTALSATQLDATASVPGTFAYSPVAGTIPSAGSDTLSVTFTPTDSTDYSASTATVSLTVNNPLPVLSAITPLFVDMGSPAFTLTVYGSGFAPNSAVHWGATALTTQYVSAGQLTAQIPVSNVATAGIVGITVQTPAPGGGTSTSIQFEIDSATSGSVTPPIFVTASDTLAPGSTATYPVTLPSSATDISATCLNLPSGASCSFSQTTGNLTITTSATTPAGIYQITVIFTETLPGATPALILLPILLLPLARARRSKAAGRISQLICLGILLIAVATSIGCGGASQTATGGSHTDTVTSSGSVTLTVQ